MVSLRILNTKDKVKAISLSQAESWNQSLEDWEFMTGNRQNVCLAAMDEDKLIGTATAMVYNKQVAWIGMVLVDKDYRGKGLGNKLLSSLIAKLKPDLALKLDATPAGQNIYRKFGFEEEYLIYRMTCPSASVNSLSPTEDSLIEQVKSDTLSEIVNFDSRVFGARRQQLFHYLLGKDAHKAWVSRQGKDLRGVVLGRTGSHFYQIGPVLASGTAEAKRLITKSLTGIAGLPVVMDVPEDKKELIQWLSTQGFSSQRHFVRMYRDKNPFPGIPGKQFAIAGPEFG